jgi:hypothetical protein
VPLQPPEAVHEVALVELQVSVEAPPAATVVGFAVKVAVDTGLIVTGATVTLTVAVLVPPEPVQVSENVASRSSAPVRLLPLVGSAPSQSSKALQESAFVEFQLNVASSPLLIVVRDALIDVMGGLSGVGPILPPPHASNISEAPSTRTNVKNRMVSPFFFIVSYRRCVRLRNCAEDGLCKWRQRRRLSGRQLVTLRLRC